MHIELGTARKILQSLLLSMFVSQAIAQLPEWEWVTPSYTSDNEYVIDMVVDHATDEIIVAGYWEGGDLSSFFPASSSPSTDLSSSYGGSDGFVARYDSNGSPLWVFKVGGNSNDEIAGVDLDGDGNIYITGFYGVGDANFTGLTSSTPDSIVAGNTSGQNAFVAKYTPAGSLLWVRYSTGLLSSNSKDIEIVSDDLYITGSSSGLTEFTPYSRLFGSGATDVFLVQYNLEGVCQWMVEAGSIDTDAGGALVADNSGVYMLLDYEGWILNIYNKDDIYSGSLNNVDPGSEDIGILSFDREGNFRWARNIGANNNDNAGGIDQDQDSIYVVGNISDGANFPSYTGNPVATGSGDNLFICSMDKATGNTGWVHAIIRSGGGDDLATKVIASTTGMLYFTGDFENPLSFPGSFTLTNDNNEDIFVASFTGNGSFNWAINGGGQGTDIGNTLDLLSDSVILVGGTYTDNSDFGTISIPSGVQSDMYIAAIQLPCSDAVGGTAAASSTDICSGQSIDLSLIGLFRSYYLAKLPGRSRYLDRYPRGGIRFPFGFTPDRHRLQGLCNIRHL